MPFTVETLGIILPYAVMLAIIGLLESLLTASVLDDMTHTESNKHKEARGQGIANIVAGFFGGMAGCATTVNLLLILNQVDEVAYQHL